MKDSKAKYLVFVDIDGVFTSTRVQSSVIYEYKYWDKFDPIAIDFFNKLHDRYEDVEFVLISTWRDHIALDDQNTKQWIDSAFRNAGFRGKLADYWKVNPHNDLELWRSRAEEIKDYLEKYAPVCKDFLIFDDNDYLFKEVLGVSRHIKTDPDNGILYKHMLNTFSITGIWDMKE